MINPLTFVYLSAKHSYILEARSKEFVINEDFDADRDTLIDSLDITQFPCLVMVSYGEGDNATAATLPISLLQCDEPEIEYED